MHLFDVVAVVPPQIHLDAGLSALQLLIRWIHVLAGIVWVGFLYFFFLVGAPVSRQTAPAERAFLVTRLMPRALWLFRWSSVVTVFFGIWYWMYTVSADARNAEASGGPAIGTFFGLWTLAFAIEMGLLMSPSKLLKTPAVFGSIVAIVIVLTSWFYVSLNQHGWESNRLLAIGIGGGMGWFMMLNVWGIFWRMQKKIIRWTKDNPSDAAMPPEITKAAELAALTARVNFYLSFPMLLFMVIAPHYRMFMNIE